MVTVDCSQLYIFASTSTASQPDFMKPSVGTGDVGFKGVARSVLTQAWEVVGGERGHKSWNNSKD
jgi:hypothetical protein